MATLRPNAHCGLSSSARAGMRQFSRSVFDTLTGGAAPRRWNRISAAPATRTTAEVAARATSSTVTSTDGKTVDMTRTRDSTSSALTMTPATALSHGRLTHGPRTAGALHSKSANTVALGSITPASAWTAVVIKPSGAYGMSTIEAARATIAL